MNKEIIERVKQISDYIIKTKRTIREVAKVSQISKSTVHKDLHERLFNIDKIKYNKVDKLLKYHLNLYV